MQFIFYDFFYINIGTEWDINAKSVINATGPFTDSIRKMDDQECPIICQPSAGVHIVLPDYYRYVLHIHLFVCVT